MNTNIFLDYSLKLITPPGEKPWGIHRELHGNLEPPQWVKD